MSQLPGGGQPTFGQKDVLTRRTHTGGCYAPFVGKECDCPPGRTFVALDAVTTFLREQGGQVDRLGLTRHWLVYGGDEKPELPVEPLGAMHEKWAQEWRDCGARVEGPFVPEAALREAIDPARIEGVLREHFGHLFRSNHYLRRAAQDVADALTNPGGRYEAE